MTDDVDPLEKETPSGVGEAAPFFVVGIGASAGGLEALTAFFGRVTFDGAAFIVVQHLARGHSSVLTELLDRASRLKVVTAASGIAVEPNHVYVAPPESDLSIAGGVLQLHPPSDAQDRAQLPIDSFFRTLAADQGSSSIGVVLSGTGTDGTFGLAAIKSAGGITFAQDPTSAKFDGMPRSALESGVADYCLTPEAIADEILLLDSNPYARVRTLATSSQEQMNKLGVLIKSAFRIELAHYKPPTIERRLQRRMALHRIQNVGDYVRLCETDPRELAALHRDLLINVTSFFRDPPAFEVLKGEVLPAIIDGKRDGADSIRIWIPGCASGEEAYSIAICLVELLEEKQSALKVQIFATDVDDDAVQQARRGTFPPNIGADVSGERLARFFVRLDDGRYQVARRIRDLIVFSTQNLSRDAPFSRLDLVSCRNLLIYLQPAIQRRVLRIVHYALRPEGFLMLGTSETVGDSAELFSLIDRRNKIYAAKHVALTPDALELGVGSAPVQRALAPISAAVTRPIFRIASLADRKIVENYAPPGVVVNENLEILYYRGRTQLYLEQPSGAPTHHILRMVRPDLRGPLKSAIEHADSSGEVSSTIAQVEGSPPRFVTLIVHPIYEPESRARCLLILFKERERELPIGAAVAPVVNESSDDRVRQLAQELALTKDYLQSTIEEVERANEDLKCANEELQSSIEELQSTNEELETSKEEMQSTNEELITLNEELQNRMRELSTSNDDLHNLLLGVDRPIVIVGMDLRIRRFTRAAERIIQLNQTDIGRSVAVLSSFVGLPIDRYAANVIAHISNVEEELQASDHRWYRLRITPYRTIDLTISGVVITLIDVELQKRRSELTDAANAYASEFLTTVQHPLLILSGELAVIWVNDAYVEQFGTLREEIVGSQLDTIAGGQWRQPAIEPAIKKTAESGAPFRDRRVEVKSVHGPKRWRVAGRSIPGDGNKTMLILLSIEEDGPA